jgi:hypothetical protein
VVENGEPRRLGQGEHIQVEFFTAGEAGRPLALGAFVNRDGRFAADLNDGSGRGIPPGQYQVRLNREGTKVSTKVNARLFKEWHPLEVAPGKPRHLTIDLAAGSIAE